MAQRGSTGVQEINTTTDQDGRKCLRLSHQRFFSISSNCGNPCAAVARHFTAV